MLIDACFNPHGGDIYSRDVLYDFSSNINPEGMPESVKNAVVMSAGSCSVYPDPYCRALRSAISELENVSPETVLCGNGAAELIYSFAYSLKKEKPALIVSPTFSEYASALKAAGIDTEHYILREEDGFRLTEDVLKTEFGKYSAVFLCSPNNPTGITVNPGLIESIAETGVRLFLDLCFLDLSSSSDLYDIPRFITEFPNAVVLRAFTKNFAVAGLRIGYVICSDKEFLKKMSEKAPCWNVSSVAQNAGIAAAKCGEWLKESVREIAVERERVFETLRSLGIRVYPGEANYLLLYSEADLFNRLLERGILVRDCSNYTGLGKGYIRIAIRKKSENSVLLSAIKEVLK